MLPTKSLVPLITLVHYSTDQISSEDAKAYDGLSAKPAQQISICCYKMMARRTFDPLTGSKTDVFYLALVIVAGGQV